MRTRDTHSGCGCEACVNDAYAQAEYDALYEASAGTIPEPELGHLAPGYVQPLDGFHPSDRQHQLEIRALNVLNRARWAGGW